VVRLTVTGCARRECGRRIPSGGVSGKVAEGECRASCRCSGGCRGYLVKKTGCVF
jgi:hypothetical protein